MLKALELAGFKSFADKTRLEFSSGVTCVVGPNGSGKSNVVDAIKWVLGSQSPKALRGSEMTDVIFNGSAGRRPQNAAEVTLEFENSAGLFELSDPAVRITRRVYRSGEGEYLINGSACRLRDIRELLAGTGVGSGAYNLIEQGRVDAVLRASPTDRRALFEEAAGISRFRMKKEEAARRLARVDQNLLRLSDIVDEVEGRLRRVRMQAGKAKRYREQSQRLKQLRTKLGLADWRGLTARLEELDVSRTLLGEQWRDEQRHVDQGEALLQSIERGDGAASAELAGVEAELASARERLVALRAAVAGDTRRLGELNESLTHARRRLVASRIEAATDAGESAPRLKRRLDEQRRLLEQVSDQAAEAAAALGRAATSRDALGSAKHDLQERGKAAERQLAELTREADRLTARLEAIHSQHAAQLPIGEAIARRRKDAARQLQQRRDELEEMATRVGEGEQAVNAARREHTRLRAELTDQLQRSAHLKAEVGADRRRLDELEAIDNQLGRLREEIASLLAPNESGAPVVVRGLVADILHVDYDTAPMIEAALGERAHHLVVENGDALLDAIGRDPGSLQTRASFQRLDAYPPEATAAALDLSGTPGVMGRADQFVEAEADFAPLVSRLLGQTWIVDTLATARRLAAGAEHTLQFVTYSGEVVASTGEVVVGPQVEAAGVLTRRRQITRLGESAAEAQHQADELASAISATQKALADAEQGADRADAEQATRLARRTELGQQLATLSERLRHLDDEQGRVDAVALTLSDQASEVESALVEARGRHEASANELSALESSRNELENQIAAAEADHGEASAAAADARVAIAAAEQHIEILAGQLAQRARESSLRRTADAEARREVVTLAERSERCRLAVLHGRSEIAGLQLVAERLARRRGQLSETRRAETSRRQLLARELHQARRRAEACRSRSQQAELEAERLRLERAAIADRMRDDYAIDLAEAARLAVDEAGAEPVSSAERATLEQELDALRGQVGAVGAVNLESLDELDELEDRFAELSAQYDDLSDAKTQLQRLSTRISTESRQFFLDTIEEVRGHFRELFRRLFGGGEADIVMLDQEGDDPLQAGVEIAASPPGKELRSISLLSGGEKTMTCVALLLAVFRTKPSPFCVLDEVDAALDEANIGRFTGVLSEFLSSTQFIVVTHSKKTMTGADTLYGVTMQESGVSKQVAVRFDDVGEDGQISPAATLRRQPPTRRAA
ncbi:MAG: chromosome segregation protein SMC [Planctomycetota bacterium]